MRISILNKDRCQPQQCSHECEKYCPRVRTGNETIVFEGNNKPIFSEKLCIGCGICVHRCPFKAIMIINLPETLEKPIHRYGINEFTLYGLPIPSKKNIVGILGPNGIGKTTVIKILSGTLIPNLGDENKKEGDWDTILNYFAGSAIYDYFKNLSDGKIKVSQKPQYIDFIPKVFKGKVSDLLEKTNERGILDELILNLELTSIVNRSITDLSGGELQRVAMAACVAKDADLYFFDELSPYLDIYQRINCVEVIQNLSLKKSILVVEHDLAILDMLADVIHLGYGVPGGYGVITSPKSVRIGINQYLKGFLKEENVRIRPEAIKFEVHPPRVETIIDTIIEHGILKKEYKDTDKNNGFSLKVNAGNLKKGEVIGIVGPNGIGKSSYLKIVAGELQADEGTFDSEIKTSYKPQYIKADSSTQVKYFLQKITSQFQTSYYQVEIANPLQLEILYDKPISELSGGELQRVAIAACLSKDADLYIFDEPSAHLDVEQRSLAAKAIKRFIKNNKKTAMVVDHDIYLIDMLSERLIVFEGEPAVFGESHGPFSMQAGMNKFLANLDITFRRDEETIRPRVNKKDSRLDREQKAKGEYYYNY